MGQVLIYSLCGMLASLYYDKITEIINLQGRKGSFGLTVLKILVHDHCFGSC